jgi:hypothetical protein
MGAFVGADFDPDGSLRQWIDGHAVNGIVRAAVAAGNLPRLKVLHGGTEHAPGRVVEGHIEMGLRRVGGFQALEHIADDDEWTLLPFEPDFLDADYRGIHPLELKVGNVGRCPKRCGTTGEESAG